MNILLVEDEVLIRMLLKQQLKTLGEITFQEANSGARALELSRTNRPDFIIMDIKLKGEMDGIQAISLINAEAIIPFIFLSAYQDTRDIQINDIPGFKGFFDKPISDENLKYIGRLLNSIKEN